jgi:2-phosphosulfolactate phosphatase
MPKIETILTPALFPLYKEGIENKNVVVIDILRATTTMCVAFGNGAEKIIPVGSPEEALLFRDQGFLVAAERNGKTVDGFELGNSPQDYTPEKVSGKKIAITTTNGTRTLRLCNAASGVFIGSFLNLSSLSEKLLNDNKDIFLFCSGWKDKFNLEDTLFAGALISKLNQHFEIFGDASHMALDLFSMAAPNLLDYLQKASHVQRFKSLHVESDLDVCLKMDTIHVVPQYRHGTITI